MTTNNSDERYRRDAAWLSLRENVMEGKGRGDTITPEECAPFLDGVSFDDMRPRIRRYFAKRKGMSLVAMPNYGYRVATSSQELNLVAPKARRSMLRSSKREVQALAGADERDLSPSEQATRIRMLERGAARHERLRVEEAQTKRELPKPPEALPRLKA